MRKPEESLEDFTVKAIAIEKASEPARVASLRFRGQVEVLRPLASWDGPADAGPPVSRLPWFQRSLAVVGGLAVIALMFLSAIFFGMYDQPAVPSVGLSDPATDHGPMRMERPLKPDIFATQNSTPAGDELSQVRSIVKPRSERPRVQVTAYKPRRQPRRPQPAVPRFVPTTLVIYAENGEIKKRIEPRISAVYKKPLTITN